MLLHYSKSAQAHTAKIAENDDGLYDKKTLAVSLLVEGKPRAYVDFFQLTNPAGGRRGGGRLPGLSSAETAEASGDLPPQSLVLLKDQLVRRLPARSTYLRPVWRLLHPRRAPADSALANTQQSADGPTNQSSSLDQAGNLNRFGSNQSV
eukprot:92559-Pelagomonas_calceolata.AAC.2